MTYKYQSPNDWLSVKVLNAGEDELRAILEIIAKNMEPDDIQDLFQDEMEEDGYFEEEE